ncbi:RNA polymerase sigma factor [Flavihumibacter petaseus]|uniref:Putative RNA polymerase ECF-type sigma factor n=1 Tax=Flavihumibacter petaseus NBRC 106054 TaxID=1220578 RepID=A0A0E9N2N5_9BACT|nr:RNA polymerase sigma factor [Flavihumibacter petaseus]GAO43896.1 putative RNA polymerase ECF-type sigma factor [Flavihumibacter petaseus NBRC 106054]
MVSGDAQQSDLQALIDGCIRKERESQSALYARFFGYGHTVCHRYVSNDADAIEVINDAFLKIFQELRNFRPQQPSLENALKAWIRRIFINTSIDHLRKRKVRTFWLGEDVDTREWLAVPPQGLDRLSHEELLKMIGKLSPAYRLVFNLFVIDGCSHEEIAKMLKISVGASKSNLARARTNLQRMILQAQPQILNHGQRAI